MEKYVDLQCFPPLIVFAQAHTIKQYKFWQYEPFRKSGFANRYQVMASEGIINLSIPVVGGRRFKGLVSQVRVANDETWQRDHWRTLATCYNRSAFFKHYESSLQNFYARRFDNLADFALQSFQWALKQLKVDVVIKMSSEEPPEQPGINRPADLRNYSIPAYQQVFDRPFEANLSILDLLFNQGPAATKYLASLSQSPK